MYLKDNKFTRGLDMAAAKLKAFGAAVAGIGKSMLLMDAATLAIFGLAARAWAKAGGELIDISDRLGISVEAITELGFAAEQTGSSFAAVEVGLGKMSRLLEDAADGSKESIDTLAKLGLTLEELQGLAPDEQFTKFAVAIRKIEDPTHRAAVAMEVFGKSGRALIPMMKQLEMLQKTAREMGFVWTREDAEKADEFGDRIDALWKQLKFGFQVVGGAVAPAIESVVKVLSTAARGVIEWLKANEEFLDHMFVMTAAFVAFDLAVFAIGKLLYGFGVVLAIVSSGISALVATIGFLLTPLGLVTAGFIALSVHVLRTSELAQSAFAAMGQSFLLMFGAIGDALKAGDWALAMEVAWTGIKIVFTQGVIALRSLWQGFAKFFVEAFHQAMTGIELAWIGFVAGLELGLADLKGAAHEALVALDKLNPFTGTDWRDRRRAEIDQQKAGIEAERDDAKRRVIQLHKFAASARDAERQAELERLGGDLSNLVDEMVNLRGRARDARAVAEAGGPEAMLAGGALAGVRGLANLREGSKVMEEAMAKAGGVRGTFESQGLQRMMGFGTDKVENEQLEEQKKIRKGVDKVAAAAAGGGLMFWQ